MKGCRSGRRIVSVAPSRSFRSPRRVRRSARRRTDSSARESRRSGDHRAGIRGTGIAARSGDWPAGARIAVHQPIPPGALDAPRQARRLVGRAQHDDPARLADAGTECGHRQAKEESAQRMSDHHVLARRHDLESARQPRDDRVDRFPGGCVTEKFDVEPDRRRSRASGLIDSGVRPMPCTSMTFMLARWLRACAAASVRC